MTLEDFAHRCLMIKAGNATLDIPCCANCKYYGEEKVSVFKNGQIYVEGTHKWICEHPEIDSDDSAFCWLNMKAEDFCSRWEERENASK